MNFFRKWFHRLWYLVWYLFAACVVFVAAVFGLVRLLLPLVDDYNQDIENYATQLVDRPIKLMSLDAEWHGLSPSLVLNNVRLLSRDGSQTLVQLSRARLDFDLIGILSTGTIQFKRFALEGTNLSIVRQETGALNLSGFESNRIEATVVNERRDILQWLLAQGEINLHAKNLIYRDRKGRDASYHFSNVSLVLRNEKDRHFIDGGIRFPAQADEEFNFSMDVTGDITTGESWSATMYFAGSNLDIARMFGDFDIQGHQLSVGLSNFEIWSEWRDTSLVGLQGDVSLRQVATRSGADFTPFLQPLLTSVKNETADATVHATKQSYQVSYDSIIGRFKWDKYQDGWQLDADHFVLSRNKKAWPASRFNLRYLKPSSAEPQLDFRATLIRLQDLTPLLPSLIGDYENYTTLSQQLALQGDVENVQVQWSGRNNLYQLAGRVKDMTIHPVGKFPGFRGLSGKVRLANTQGSIALNTADGEFSYPRMFRWDIPVAKLQGDVTWRQDNNKLTVSSRNLTLNTAHAKSRSVLDLDIPLNGGSPFISLIMKFNDGDGSKASYYYPVSIMKDKTVKWLDSSIVQGKVTSGGAIVYGPLEEFPFTKGQGVFDVRFATEDAILDYADGWPQIHQARANVVFRGNSLSVTSNQARIFNSSLSDVDVTIENLKAKPLKLAINGRVSGKSQEKLNYLMVSPPLNEIYGQYLRDLKATGDSDLDLDIQLKIADKVDSTVSGKLYLKNNGLTMSAVPDMLSSMTGTLRISDKGIQAKNIKADLLGQSGRLDVQTLQRRGVPERRDIIVKAVGEFDARKLSAQRFPVMKDLVDGRARWQIMLSVPSGGDAKTRRNVQLAVTSKLRGVAINLPPPFEKKHTDSRTLEVFMEIKDPRRMMLKVSYADRFAGIFEGDASAPMWVVRGDVRLGGGPVVLPPTKGLRVAGKLKELSIDIWKTLIEQTIEQYESDSGSKNRETASTSNMPAHMALVDSVDLRIDNFEIFGQKLTNLNLEVNNKERWLAAQVDSDQLEGAIIVPANLDSKPLEFDMQRVHLTSAEPGGSKPDPRELPGIIFNSRSFTYENKKLGAVAFELAKTNNGLLLQQIIVRPRATTVKGHGYWLVEQGQEESMFEFELNSDDLGKTMKDLGYVDTISGGQGTISAKLHWPGPIIDPDLHHISGSVELDFKDGRILDIEPGGAARLFGLFSLQTLPRRLTLDFSDLFGKGLGFDSVHGQFNVESGDAYTTNFGLQGPSADVSLSGRIGLGSQDYDQRMEVTPHIGDTAFFLSIITSQPLLFFFQQLLKEDFDKATSIEYSLTGPWDNYKLEPLVKEVPLAPDNEEF